MPLKYIECFGERLDSPNLKEALQNSECPFVGGKCSKQFQKGPISGSCVLALESDSEPVICCPKRLYANNYQVLQEVANRAFGKKIQLVLEGDDPPPKRDFAVPLGQKQGKEVRVPYQEKTGGSKFSVDWIIARVSAKGKLLEFVATEIQTIDTTGNYQRQFWQIAEQHAPEVVEPFESPEATGSSFNYENVNKRILPQLITKGHILKGEKLCKNGMFFVCPERVLERILNRVGKLQECPPQTGAITILGYQIDQESSESPAPLVLMRSMTTLTERLALAFSSPASLPPPGVYEEEIKKAIAERLKH